MKRPMVYNTESKAFRGRAARRRRVWSITRHRDLDGMKDAEYAYWSTQPTHVVMAAVSDMTAKAFAMKGIRVRRLQRPHRAPQ
jgi:hypothetical protein